MRKFESIHSISVSTSIKFLVGCMGLFGICFFYQEYIVSSKGVSHEFFEVRLILMYFSYNFLKGSSSLFQSFICVYKPILVVTELCSGISYKLFSPIDIICGIN